MTARSRKQRLIDALQAEVDGAGEHTHQLWLLRRLRERGSGPLPGYLRREAEKRGLA